MKNKKPSPAQESKVDLFANEQLDLATAIGNLGERGHQLIGAIRDISTAPDSTKKLREFGLAYTTRMVGCSTPKVHALLAEHQLPHTKPDYGRLTVPLPTINRIRDILRTRPARPAGANCKVVAVVNQKGGVGKTVTSIHLAQYLALEGYRVLAVDCDPQGSLTTSFGIVPNVDIHGEDTIYDALIEGQDHIHRVIRKTYWDGLDLIPAELELQAADMQLPLVSRDDPLGPAILRLRKTLELVMSSYDVVVLDAPPSMSMLSLNAIMAADLLLVPVPPAMYEVSSTIAFFRTISAVLSRVPERDRRHVLMRIQITKHDGHKQSIEIEHMIRHQLFSGFVLNNSMMLSDEIAKSASDMKTVYEVERPRGARSTWVRAVTLLDAANREVSDLLTVMWENEVRMKQSVAAA